MRFTDNKPDRNIGHYNGRLAQSHKSHHCVSFMREPNNQPEIEDVSLQFHCISSEPKQHIYFLLVQICGRDKQHQSYQLTTPKNYVDVKTKLLRMLC